MRNGLACYINKLIITILILSGIGINFVTGQELISGVINSYAKVGTIAPGYVVLATPSQALQYTPGDYVLLMQMQGVGIQTSQGSYGINVQSRFGVPGGYELLMVQSVNSGTGRIDFTRNVYINNFNIIGNIQLIRVPFYNSPVVTGTLGSQPWNSITGTGGVLAMMAGRKLTMNADIDVSGQGFAGAAAVSGIGECVNINDLANNHDSYPLTWNNAGFKGEGIAIHDQTGVLLLPDHAKGKGPNFTGGGGGNGRFSGGGGGSNRGKGAGGGLENGLQCSNDPRDGGFGGMNIIGTIIQQGIFAGGGGGASTQATGSTASAGGNGGGIVILIADTIIGNNHIIRSNGITALNSASDAGSGGGGAGGSVALFFNELSGQALISADGGNGGSNPGSFGEGGGGGGGLIWISSPSIPASVTNATVANGAPAPTILSEGLGEIKFNYSPNLNGFLFNSVWSAASGNRVDSVCSDIMYGQIVGTKPVGGTPPYTFLWESSTTSASAGFTTAPGTNNLRYYTPPSLLTQTTWFRRVVTDNSTPVIITDISLPVQVVVHPFIKNNVIGDPDTLCYGQDPSLLNSRLVLQDGNGLYAFRWESSTDNILFSNASSPTESYLPPSGMTQTTWYRRTVTSGSCLTTSASIRINVLEPISNNTILTPAQEICEGMTFLNLDATVAPALAGGDNTYRFRWERSQDGTTWVIATGMTNNVNYNPEENAPPFPGHEYYRRVVLSGSGNVCADNSEPVLLNEYPVITNNSIVSGDQTICSGSIPLQLTGSAPLNGKGAGSYTFTWQDSSGSHSWTDIPGYTSVPGQDFIPPALTDTTRYRRIAYSSACSNTSEPVIINVHKPIADNTVSLLAGGLSDTTLCDGATPHRFTGSIPSGGTGIAGSYIYQWSSSPDNAAWSDITAANSRFYQPAALSATSWYRRRVSSGECFSESAPVKVNVLPLIKDNTISGNLAVCKDDIPSPLTQATGVTISGGAGSGSFSYFWEESRNGTTWAPAAGTNNSSNGTYQPPVMKRTIHYRRNATSGAGGCCTSTSNTLELTLDSLPPGSTINAGPDTTIYSFDKIVTLVADPALAGGTGKWTLIEGSGSFENDTENDTRVNGLSKGLNKFLWTVTRGACKLEDIVEIMIYDIVIPEGFSPNNDPDGYNNTFVVRGLDLPNQDAEMVIINGAGSEVFSTSNRNGNEWHEWNGTNSRGSDMPEGTYYYLLKITSKGNGQVFKKSGFIVLKRY
ncbi:MAG: gliding motility-associated C-terminal domain-containing protein [Bacteroidales bacterium]